MKLFTSITKTHKPFPFFLFLFLFPSAFPKSNAADTLTAGQNLTDDGTTLVSSGETFELGFFTPIPPPAGAEQNRYLGIWYKKISQRTYVWVANRDSPATTEIPAVLQLTHLGILTLSTSNSTNSNSPSLLFSSNSSRTARNPVAQLLDSGNFVIREENDPDPANYLWQSFDYPGDTFLPGMKHGRNFVTGLDRIYRSSTASNDPSPGNYTFRIDTHGYPQQFLSSGSTETFRSGPWNGERWSGSPGLNPNRVYTYEFVFNEQEVYYKFDLVNPDVYSRLILQPNGVLNRFVWQNNTGSWNQIISAPADDCDRFGLCRSYGACNLNRYPICGCLDRFVPRDPVNWERSDWSSGCVRRTPLNNVSCQEDRFIMYSDIKVPDTRGSWYDRNMTLKECRRRCLENCTCTAYTSLDIRNGGSGCLLWFGDLIDIRQYSGNGQDIFIRMASSEIGGSNHKTVTIVAIVISVIAVIVLALALFVWYVKRKKKRQEQGKEKLEMQPQRDAEGSEQRYTVNNPNEDLELPLLEFAMIAKATDHFSLENKLGEGGFGPVYKGMLEGGQEIAVKRLSEYSSQGLHEFKNEVICIAKLQHRNLVRLLGCCIQGEEKLLVYEYMANKSLDIFIFDETRRNLLDWPKCFNIINGTARGLLYLHQDSRLRIIHRDLKASNILLDIDMNPKISDFGMARSFGGNETEANTQKVVGTYGYMSPEYAVDGIFSTKSDVFSFGVLILEIVSGKRNRGFLTREHHHNLLGHAWILHKQGRSLELIDVNIVDSCYLSEILRSIHVALLCVQRSPEDRPNMSSVVLMLVGEGTLPEPQEPGFFTERNIYFGKDSSSLSQTKNSANHSITLVDAR